MDAGIIQQESILRNNGAPFVSSLREIKTRTPTGLDTAQSRIGLGSILCW